MLGVRWPECYNRLPSYQVLTYFLDEVHIAATMSSEAVLPSDWTAHTVQRAAPSDCSALQLVLVNAMQPCRWQYEHLAIEIRDDMCTPGCD